MIYYIIWVFKILEINEKNYFLNVLLVCFLFSQSHAVEKGKWSFVVDDNYCYIGSSPNKEEGKYKERGPTYVIVYRINRGLEKIVQVTAGYNYDENKPVIVKIDQTSFEFFGKEDSAWTKDRDKEVIYAMQKGIEMIVQGHSSRGTLTTDTYTLQGFTTAFNKLSKDC